MGLGWVGQYYRLYSAQSGQQKKPVASYQKVSRVEDVNDLFLSNLVHTQVLLLHIEDHMDGQHGEAFNQVNARFGNRVYTSGGCGDIPGNLTKQDVLNLGRNVVIWNDGGCSGDGNWNGMVLRVVH